MKNGKKGISAARARRIRERVKREREAMKLRKKKVLISMAVVSGRKRPSDLGHDEWLLLGFDPTTFGAHYFPHQHEVWQAAEELFANIVTGEEE